MVGVAEEAVQKGDGVSNGVEEGGCYSRIIGVAEVGSEREDGVSNGVEGPSGNFFAKGAAFFPRVIGVDEVRGGLRKCRAGRGWEDICRQMLRRGGRGQTVAGRRWFQWKGCKPAQRGWSVGRGFGGHGGDRWKESGR